MPINPQTAAKFPLLDGLTSPLNALSDPGQRAQLEAYNAWTPGYEPPPVDTSEASADGRHGAIPLRIYRPLRRHETVAELPALIWLHGGGWLAGDLDMPEADTVGRELAHRADAVVLTVDYRLASNGVTYPVPHDDVVDAFRWATRHAAELRIDPQRISLGGASAGANLACGAALRLRDDAHDPQPSRLLLVYPLVHAKVPPRSPAQEVAMADVPAVLRFPDDLIEQLVANYLGRPFDDPSELPAYAVPAEAGSVQGLPPTLVITCEYDDLRPSGEALAHMLEEASVPVLLEKEDGVLHGHLNEDPRIPQVDHSLSLLAAAICGDFITDARARPQDSPSRQRHHFGG
jgi:acetyl esterase